jgi:hypothetical protein
MQDALAREGRILAREQALRAWFTRDADPVSRQIDGLDIGWGGVQCWATAPICSATTSVATWMRMASNCWSRLRISSECRLLMNRCTRWFGTVRTRVAHGTVSVDRSYATLQE